MKLGQEEESWHENVIVLRHWKNQPNVPIEAPMPTRKPLMMMLMLHKLGLLKQKDKQYEKEAAAGPKSSNREITPCRTFRSVDVNTETPKA